MEIEQAILHTGELTPQRIYDRCLEAVPHYIWMWGHGEKKSGICSACHGVMHGREELEDAQWALGDPYIDSRRYDPFLHPDWYKRDAGAGGMAIHGRNGYCPLCGALITYRDMGRGHAGLRNKLIYGDIRKSAAEENALCLILYGVEADWNKQLHEGKAPSEFEPDLFIFPYSICIFRYGKGCVRFTRKKYYFADWDAKTQRACNIRREFGGWERRKEVAFGASPYGGIYGNVAPCLMHLEDVETAMADTGFGRVMALADYRNHCGDIFPIRWLAMISRYPAIEYLFKLGQKRLGYLALNGDGGKLLNLRGKDAAKVLRIRPECWGWLKGRKLEADAHFLECSRICDTYRIGAGFDLIWRYSRLHLPEHLLTMALRLSMPGLAKKAMQYILKKGIDSRDYADHLCMMAELGMGMDDRGFLFPSDFAECHAKLASRIKVREDEAMQRKLEAHLKKQGCFSFSAVGLVLSPIKSIGDVIREGTALCHCVANYANRYADGQIMLCTLRAEEKMDVPLYTVEFDLRGKKIQCRGYKNRDWPGDEERLSLFWQLYEAMRRQEAQQARRRRAA